MALHNEVDKSTQHQNQRQGRDSERHRRIDKFAPKFTVPDLQYKCGKFWIDGAISLELFRAWNERNLLFCHPEFWPPSLVLRLYGPMHP